MAKNLVDGYSRAAGYYQNHANEGIIRKLQNFLYSRGYDLGDNGIDGRFGQSTYNAIRQYQRDNGLKDDGMWGEDTNSVHRVLSGGDNTFSGKNSGAHPGVHTYDGNFANTTYQTSKNVSYSDINNAIEKAIKNPEWFWGNSEDAKNWRLLFEKGTPDGKGGINRGAILEEIWRETPQEVRDKISYSKLPTNLQQQVYVNDINTARNEAAPVVATAAALPVMASNPVALVGGVAGGYLGSKVGGNLGKNVWQYATDENGNVLTDENGKRFLVNQNNRLVGDLTGFRAPTVIPNKERQGEIIGGIAGAMLGAGAGEAVSKVNFEFDPWYNGSGIQLDGWRPVVKTINPAAKTKITLPAVNNGPGNIVTPERTIEIGKIQKRPYTWKTDWRPTPPRPNADGTYNSSKPGVVYTVQTPGDLFVTEPGLNAFRFGGKLIKNLK